MTTHGTKSRRWYFPPRNWGWRIVLVYVALLLVSHVVRILRHSEGNVSDAPFAVVQAVKGENYLDEPIHIAYRDYGSNQSDQLPVVLLHGSPGQKENFRYLAPALSRNRRVIALDLPGFGNSSLTIPDYSFRAHARYVLEMLDNLGISKAHFVGFSMGGGVVLNIADIAPQRVASITMISAISVQEMELLGDYHLNHAVHALQLAGLWIIRDFVPDFGYLGDTRRAIAYGRNFYDSDQRPLREILLKYNEPMLILHGREDELVPVEAAIEDSRLVPQSQLRLYDQNHFMVFDRDAMLSQPIDEFLRTADDGSAVTKANALTDRIAQSRRPFEPGHMPRAIGMTAAILLVLLAGATLISEDLACISAGVLVANGRLGFLGATIACFSGIYIGDLLLFLAGRYFGRSALRWPPLKWMIRPESVERSSGWLSRNIAKVILSSRFLPGTRLPTYFAAGMLNTDFWRFAFFFLLACALWTPLLVSASVLLGAEILHSVLLAGQSLMVKLLIVAAVVYIGVRLIIKISSFRGRRMLVSRFRRITRWEFWPAWIFYPPVIGYVMFLIVKHRSLSLFTATNPGIPAGGFIAESKSEILNAIGISNGYVARFKLLPASLEPAVRFKEATTFIASSNFTYPLVLKPDAGQRGSGVAIIRSETELQNYLSRADIDIIIQEYIDGAEFGVFYYRYPRETRGRILSITEKVFPVVTGDGVNTVERLILNDNRAVAMATLYLEKQKDRLQEILAVGERLQLVELGTHCRGAIFLDGSWVKSAELETRIDQISKTFDGFYFGRYDIRTGSVEAFRRGENFKIVELNGVTSESTHIYDPGNSLITAYRALFRQWKIAFEIGSQNRSSGSQITSVLQLVKLLSRYRRLSKSHI